MWFTRVSLQNPVFVTMAMLASVVLGLLSSTRLKVDQFQTLYFQLVVVTTCTLSTSDPAEQMRSGCMDVYRDHYNKI